jgi:predicted SnoaL-like aldol condensation-catalyzing enzyme
MKNVTAGSEFTLNDASRSIVMNHLNSFIDQQLEGVLSDYTEESVLITQDASYTGPEEIRGFFTGLMAYFPNEAPGVKLDKLIVNNDLVFIVWHATTPSLEVKLGTGTFIIRDGKIHQ